MLTNNSRLGVITDGIDMSFFQRQLLYILLFLLPWFVIPLPWDPTEQIKIVLFIIISSLIILLEVIKWIWDGKVTISKSVVDRAFLLLALTFFISSVFAADKWTALWGFDGRLGTGFLSLSILFLLFFVSRNFLSNSKSIIRAIEVFVLGISILSILSLLSLFKVNIFGWMPVIKNFFIIGLPLTFHAKEILLICLVAIFMSIFLTVNYLKEKRFQRILLPFIAMIIAFVSIPLFSVNQGVIFPILIFVSLIFTSVFLFLKLEKSFRFFPILLSIFLLISTLFAIGLQYDSFKNSILGDTFEVMSSVSLAPDISWTVSSQVIVGDFFRGVVGLGNESFAIAYNLFKPATQSTISFSNASFISSSSELFTTLASRGILGVIVWLFLGLMLIKTFINDLTSSLEENYIPLLILQICTIAIYIGSFFVHFSFLLYFVFIISILFSVVLRNIYKKNNEQFVLKFWAVNVGGVSQDVNKTVNGVNWFLTGLVIVVVFGGLVALGYRFVSVMYLARAEAFSAEESAKYKQEEEVTLEIREDFFNSLMSYYSTSLRYDSSNPIANRKASSTAIEIIKVLSEIYEKASEEEKSSILSEISAWKNTAIDLSKEAINVSPNTYANWYVRSNVYIGLLTIGFSDYSEDALAALQMAVNLNPLDFESYYRAGQIYMIKEDYERALAAFNRGLSINGQHVPSLILSARIFNEQGDTKTAVSYLEAAQKIMELNKLEDDPLYQNIINALSEFKSSAKIPIEEKSLEKQSEDELTDELFPID